MKRIVPRYIYKVAPLAIIGVTFGHLLLYKWLFPDVSHRHDALSDSGHGYFPYLIIIAVSLSAISVWKYFVIGRQNSHKDQVSLYKFIFTLFAAQSIIFILIEAAERFAHGGLELVSTFMTSSTPVIGIIFQFLVACIVSVLVHSTIMIGRFFAEKNHVPIMSQSNRGGYNSPDVAYIWMDLLIYRGPPKCY